MPWPRTEDIVEHLQKTAPDLLQESEFFAGGSTLAQMRRFFRIEEGERVIDIGCGGDPFQLATHLTDILPKEVNNPLPYCQCSAEALPFRDKAFDFVFCSHVLEHMADPAAACREMIRIGKRGYIECPRSWHEYVFPSHDHRWLIDHEANCLIFREMLAEERMDILGLQIPYLEFGLDPDFQRYWKFRFVRMVRNVEFYWENDFKWLVLTADDRKNAGTLPWFYDRPRLPMTGASLAKLIHYIAREILRTIKKRMAPET